MKLALKSGMQLPLPPKYTSLCKFYFLFYVYGCLPAECLWTMCVPFAWRGQKRLWDSPGNGGTDSCKSHRGAGNQTQALWRTASTVDHWIISPVLTIFIIIIPILELYTTWKYVDTKLGSDYSFPTWFFFSQLETVSQTWWLQLPLFAEPQW